MSRASKIFAGVLVFLVIMLFVIVAIPNLKDGGNKNIIPVPKSADQEAVSDSAHADTKSDETAVVSEPISEEYHPSFTFNFTAFKTPEKVGVNGTFNSIQLSGAKKADKLSESLTGSNFVIQTSSVFTNDPANQRDPKLKSFFFEKMSSPEITGSFKSFNAGKAVVNINMNGQSKDFNFNYTEGGDSLTVNGKIDIVSDFKANAALASVAEACKDLHENKTWSDVDVKVVFKK